MRRAVVLTAVLGSMVLLTACANTIRGAGRDIDQAGQATQDAVRDITE